MSLPSTQRLLVNPFSRENLVVLSLSGSVAQLVEHWTFNPLVEGSSPSRPTIQSRKVRGLRLAVCGQRQIKASNPLAPGGADPFPPSLVLRTHTDYCQKL